MLVGKPAEQVGLLCNAVGQDREPRTHLGKIADDLHHVVDRQADIRFDSLLQFRAAAIKLNLRPRLERRGAVAQQVEADKLVISGALHRQRRVDKQVDAKTMSVEHHPHGVDEKRNVIGDEHEHGTVRSPAVALEIRGIHAHQDLAGGSPSANFEVRHGGRVCLIERPIVDVIVGQPAVIPLDK